MDDVLIPETAPNDISPSTHKESWAVTRLVEDPEHSSSQALDRLADAPAVDAGTTPKLSPFQMQLNDRTLPVDGSFRVPLSRSQDSPTSVLGHSSSAPLLESTNGEDEPEDAVFDSLPNRRSLTKSPPRSSLQSANRGGSSARKGSISSESPYLDNLTDLGGSPASKRASTITNFASRFPDVPDALLQYFSCAWEKEILWQGRLYITSGHLCFYSKIFGNEIKQIIRLADVVELEKSNVAALIPNAITIRTKDTRFFFASFLKRDTAFDAIHQLWILETKSSQKVPDLSIDTNPMGGKSDDTDSSLPDKLSKAASRSFGHIPSGLSREVSLPSPVSVSKRKQTVLQGIARVIVVLLILSSFLLSLQLFLPLGKPDDLLLKRATWKKTLDGAGKAHRQLFASSWENAVEVEDRIKSNLAKIKSMMAAL
ncbi:hypothetical protein HDU91_000814 [Kappamyces sp. JEL0680]|nr:hypothetical protein HDU91_000814 [Kappamyces sp. JEL0680]